jgi:hypothetical protein
LIFEARGIYGHILQPAPCHFPLAPWPQCDTSANQERLWTAAPVFPEAMRQALFPSFVRRSCERLRFRNSKRNPTIWIFEEERNAAYPIILGGGGPMSPMRGSHFPGRSRSLVGVPLLPGDALPMDAGTFLLLSDSAKIVFRRPDFYSLLALQRCFFFGPRRRGPAPPCRRHALRLSAPVVADEPRREAAGHEASLRLE